MKLATQLERMGDIEETVRRVVELERAGLDILWIPESYGFDAFSQVGFMAARTYRLQIGTGIVNVFSRTAAVMAMTAAGCDHVSSGRFLLGLGASGPQVIEGFHGLPFEQPMYRIREYIEACRMIWRREPFVIQGRAVQVPLPAGAGTGLGKPLRLFERPVRTEIPIWWASIKGLSVEATAELADGWLPAMFIPEKFKQVWGPQLDAGLARRDSRLGPLQISAGGILAIGEDLVGDTRDAVLDDVRPHMALYVGGMGAPGKNFYNDVCRDYGYPQEAADIQEHFIGGRKTEAAASVPAEWLELSNLVGPAGHIAERISAYREAGVTVLSVNPVGPEPVRQIEALKEIIENS